MIKIMCIHGIGGKDACMELWSNDWKKSIRQHSGFKDELQFNFFTYDDLFSESKQRMGGIKYAAAISKFLASWIGDANEKLKKKEFLKTFRWYAGMPVQFVTDVLLRRKLRLRLTRILAEFRPDLVYAHSLGSLLVYDLLRQKSSAAKNRHLVLVTSGSQLAHPSLRFLFGDILPLPVKCWINLHNEMDKVFASRPVCLLNKNFLAVQTNFEYKMLNHDVLHYISHAEAINAAWPVALSQCMVAKKIALKHRSEKESVAYNMF